MIHSCARLGIFDYFGWTPADDVIQNLKFAVGDCIQCIAADIHKAIAKPPRPAEDENYQDI